MTDLAWIAVGGGAGSVARYLVSAWAARALGAGFPSGTLIVNFAGSMLLAFLMVLSLESEAVSPTMRLALGTGVMGGFTTYSTFNYETMALLEQGAYLLAASNVALTLLGCLAGGWIGLVGGRLAVGA